MIRINLAQSGEINTALLAILLLALAGIGVLVKQGFQLLSVILQAKIDAVQAQVNMNHEALTHLANGGGDEKVDNRLRALGVIPALAHGVSQTRRKSDRQTLVKEGVNDDTVNTNTGGNGAEDSTSGSGGTS